MKNRKKPKKIMVPVLLRLIRRPENFVKEKRFFG